MFFIFAIKPFIKDDVFAFKVMVLTVSNIQNNSLTKRLENTHTKKNTFDFVAFLVS